MKNTWRLPAHEYAGTFSPAKGYAQPDAMGKEIVGLSVQKSFQLFIEP